MLIFIFEVVEKITSLFKFSSTGLDLIEKAKKLFPDKTDPSEIKRQLIKRLLIEFEKQKKDRLLQESNVALNFSEEPQQVGRPKARLREDLKKFSFENIFLKIFSTSSKKKVSSKTSISSIYRRSDIQGKLLILGKPGYGKTTELLKLATELIEDAVKDEKLPFPVLFELSRWQENQSISQWIILELKSLYKLSPSIGEDWLSNYKIILLFDGLDELVQTEDISKQISCIKEINKFLKESLYPSLVVCCRQEEHEETKYLLEELNGAICLEPISLEKIKAYLKEIDRSGLWKLIDKNQDLEELVKVPLFLSMFITSYNGANVDIKNEHGLMEAYLNYSLDKFDYKDITQQKDRKYLNWLANRLVKDNLKDFQIENINVLYLGNETQKRSYLVLVTIICILIYLLSVGIPFIFFWKAFFDSLGIFLLLMLIALLPGLYVILKIGRETESIQVDKLSWSSKNLKKENFYTPFLLLIYDILVLSDIGGLQDPKCMIDLLSRNFTNILNPSIDPFFLSCLAPGFSFRFILIHVIIATPLYIFLAGLKPVSIQLKSGPNQGIWLSVQNALVFFSVSALEAGIVGGPFVARFGGLASGIAWGVIIGITGGLMPGLYYGGFKAIQHLALRIILCKNGCIPWDYAGFLEYAVQNKILQQVRGRYRFIHSLLQTHLIQSE